MNCVSTFATNPPNRSIPLQVDDKDPSVLSIAKKDFTLIAPGTYRVHLISNETGFDNKYTAQNTKSPSILTKCLGQINLLAIYLYQLMNSSASLVRQMTTSHSSVELNLRINNGRWQRDILYPVNEEDPLEEQAITIRHNLDLLKYTFSR